MGQGTVQVQYPAPTVQNIVVCRDTDTTLAFVLLDNLGLHPVDITSDTVKLAICDIPGGSSQIATMTNASGQHTDPTNGKTSFTISKATINASAASATRDTCWVYEVRRLTGGSAPEVVHMTGEFRVKPTVVAT